MDSRFVVPPRSVFLAAVLVAACGGGSSPSSPSYPAIKGTYGSYSGTVEGSSVTSIPDQSGQHTGVVNLGSLLANGRVTVRCDDGQVMAIEEQLTGRLPTPPSTPG